MLRGVFGVLRDFFVPNSTSAAPADMSRAVIFEEDHSQIEKVSEPFLVFPCGKCKEQITLTDHLEPGQVAVILCDNCKESWVAVLPSIFVVETAKYEPVWEKLSA